MTNLSELYKIRVLVQRLRGGKYFQDLDDWFHFLCWILFQSWSRWKKSCSHIALPGKEPYVSLQYKANPLGTKVTWLDVLPGCLLNSGPLWPVGRQRIQTHLHFTFSNYFYWLLMTIFLFLKKSKSKGTFYLVLWEHMNILC